MRELIYTIITLSLFFSVVYTVKDLLLAFAKKIMIKKLVGAAVLIKAEGDCDNTEALFRFAKSLEADKTVIVTNRLSEEGKQLISLISKENPSAIITDRIEFKEIFE